MYNQNVIDIHNRKLDNCYFSIMCIPTNVFVNNGMCLILFFLF